MYLSSEDYSVVEYLPSMQEALGHILKQNKIESLFKGLGEKWDFFSHWASEITAQYQM